MGDVSWTELLDILFRWFHVFFGIMWIGLLYFFNFVNGPYVATLDAETKKKAVPELMPRALFFFRWAAMFTFILGWLLFFVNYAPNNWEQFNTTRGHWISLGILFGTIMWFNVWFVIWPAQRKIINGIKTGPPAAPEIAKRATLASKINTYLSVPLIFSMLAAGKHFLHDEWYWFVGVLVVGYFAVNGLYKTASKVSTNV
jgi:uncharacterized membrane protein